MGGRPLKIDDKIYNSRLFFSYIKKYRPYFLFFSILALLAASFQLDYINPGLLFNILSSIILFFFALTIIKEKSKYRELYKLHQLHEKSTEHMIQTYIDDYTQVDMLNRIGKIILSGGSGNDYLKGIASTLNDLKYEKVSFFISDFNNNKIFNAYNQGYDGAIENHSFERSDIKINSNYLFSIINIDELTSVNSELPFFSHIAFIESDFPLIFVPIILSDSPLGFFFVTPDKSFFPLGKKKSKFLMGVASQIALGIHKQHAFYEIAQSDRIKTEFIATASHELKTPVQTIMSGLSELEFTKDIESNLPLLKRVAGKMALQISNLLSSHRIESKHYSLDISTVSIADILAKIEDSALANASVNSHSLIFTGFDLEDVTLSVDIDRLASAIMDLINNSCKYTPPGGTIQIRYSKSHSEHRISIIDNGIGIPMNYQDKIFIKFYQVPNRKNLPTGGIGLGLSIVKEIVSLHNGDITVISPLPLNQPDIALGGERIGTNITINLPMV